MLMRAALLRISGAQRLRLKESDRLSSLYVELRKMGAQIEMDTNSLIVRRSLCLAWRSD